MSKPSAKVICHSKAPNGEELITMEVEFHRFILAEVNTHRVLSRNYQSSRAVPIEKMIEQVKTDPAIPIHWGKNQRGMVADEEQNELVSNNQYTVEDWWKLSALSAARFAEELHLAGYHKQIVNRLLEPFIWTKGVITTTKEGWESVFKLRLHKDSQPEFQALAKKIKEAIDESEPDELDYGSYHLPYVEHPRVGDFNLKDAIKISTSCTAQVSYRVLDDSLEKALKVYGMLNLPVDGVYPEDPPHFSPAEHVVKVVDEYYMAENLGIIEEPILSCSGNFQSRTFWQYRKALEVGQEKEFIEEN